MMKFSIPFLAAALAFPALLPATEARVDLNGIKEGIQFTKTAGDGVNLYKATWVKPEEQSQRVFLQKKLSGDYQEVAFTFTADKSGTIWIAFGGNWMEKAEERPFVLLDDITINGEALPNGGFEEALQGNWSKGKDVTTSPDAHSGSAAIRVNHDNQISMPLKVEAGKSYEVKSVAKETK